MIVQSRTQKVRYVQRLLAVINNDRCTCLIIIQTCKFQSLVDTDGQLSVISESTFKHIKSPLQKSYMKLRTVSGQQLRVLGETTIKVEVGKRQHQHTFQVVTTVNNNVILGYDFWPFITCRYISIIKTMF